MRGGGAAREMTAEELVGGGLLRKLIAAVRIEYITHGHVSAQICRMCLTLHGLPTLGQYRRAVTYVYICSRTLDNYAS